jgi:putative transposase
VKKLQIESDSPIYDDLVELYRKEKNHKLKERYHALVLMHEFKNCPKVAQLLKRSRRIVQSWINAFNKGGIEALIPIKPPGRPSRLSKEQMRELETDVLTHPRKLGYDFSNWEGKSVSYHIKKKFGVVLKVRQCQNLLHEMDLTLQRPRHEFPNADPKERERFIRKFKKSWISLEKTT